MGRGPRGQLLGLGAPGSRGQGTTRDSQPDPQAGPRPLRPPASRQAGPRPREQGEPGPDEQPDNRGLKPPGTRRTGLRRHKPQCRGSFGGPGVLSPGTLPMACLPARGYCAFLSPQQQQTSESQDGASKGPPLQGRRRVSKASSTGLRGLLPWLACVGGGAHPEEAGHVPEGPAGTLGRDSEV